jgi:hypothetical protein
MKSFTSFPKAAPVVPATIQSAPKRSAIESPTADRSIKKPKKNAKKPPKTAKPLESKGLFVIQRTGDKDNFMYQSSGNAIAFRRHTKHILGDTKKRRVATKPSDKKAFYTRLKQHLRAPPLFLKKDDEKDESSYDFIAFPMDFSKDEQTPFVEEPESGAFTKRSAEFSQKLFSEPKNIDLWVEFIEFQSDLANVGAKSKKMHSFILEKQVCFLF